MAGNKNSGRIPGKVTLKTEQWNKFCFYCLNGGLEKFQREMNKLQGKDYAQTFIQLLEFFKPKLSRAELTGLDGETLIPDVDLSKLNEKELRTLAELQSKCRISPKKVP